MNHVRLLTAPGTAALAVVRIEGPDASFFFEKRLNRIPSPGRLTHGNWTLDDGSVLDDPLVRGGDGWFEVHLHGGRRIVDRFLEDAENQGFSRVSAQPPSTWRDWLPHATTVAGLQLLAAQEHADPADADPEDRTLQRLLKPAIVAIVGPANAGKSTLVNALAGRQASLVADRPGTTRDWVETTAVLCDGRLPVRLADTPGRRDDPEMAHVERSAIDLSDRVIDTADLVVRVLDATRPAELPGTRPGTLDVWNKTDLVPAATGLNLSATQRRNIDKLEQEIARRLGCRLDLPPRPLLC